MWVRQHRIGSLETEAAGAAERHAFQIAVATAAERASIARELHDVVSHAVSVVVIQAQVGRRALPDDVPVAQESLASIETSARNAMTELRQLLTVLTPDDETVPTTPMVPVASLRHVDALIEECRAAGLTVEAEIDPGVGPGTPMADLAAYRLLQEALTNTMRHAPGATARVSVRQCGDMLEVTAADDGAPTTGPGPSHPTTGPGTGRGLIGMRERVALAGGQLVEAGRRGDGFRVHALIPAAPGHDGEHGAEVAR